VFSIELLLDGAGDAAVRADWALLIAAGLPSSGRHTGASNRPHVTTAVRDQLSRDAAVRLGEVADLLPAPLELNGLLLFGHRDRYVLARQIVVGERLLDLHRRVADVAGLPEPRYANTGVGRWTPHVTLARSLDAGQVADALRAVEAPRLVIEAVGLRIWDAAAKTVTTVR
jgi:2'-5' RNA ligase